MRRVLGFVGFLLLLFGVAGRAIPLATTEGRQCPTAGVHTVRVAVKSACGCVVGHIERAPKPGEKGFVQCRCSEKRTAQESSAPPAPALAPLPTNLTFAIVPASFERPVLLLAADPLIVRAPSVPPPATV